MSDSREAFDKWISSPPYSRLITRFSTNPEYAGWHGQYRDLSVQIAWESWSERDAEIEAFKARVEELEELNASYRKFMVGLMND